MVSPLQGARGRPASPLECEGSPTIAALNLEGASGLTHDLWDEREEGKRRRRPRASRLGRAGHKQNAARRPHAHHSTPHMLFSHAHRHGTRGASGRSGISACPGGGLVGDSAGPFAEERRAAEPGAAAAAAAAHYRCLHVQGGDDGEQELAVLARGGRRQGQQGGGQRDDHRLGGAQEHGRL